MKQVGCGRCAAHTGMPSVGAEVSLPTVSAVFQEIWHSSTLRASLLGWHGAALPLALSVWHLRMCMFGVPPCECGGPCLSRLSRLPAAAALLLGWLSVHAPAPFCSAPPCHSWPKGCCLVSPGLASTCLAWEAGKAGKASRVLLRRTAAIDGRACFLLPVGCWLLHTAYMLAPSMLLLQRSRRHDCIFALLLLLSPTAPHPSAPHAPSSTAMLACLFGRPPLPPILAP